MLKKFAVIKTSITFAYNYLTKQFKTNKMKKEIKTMELYVSPMRERNIDKLGEFSNQCICCGKEVKEQHKVVYMGVDWLAYNTTEVTRINGLPYITGTDVEIQGAFPIGNDCAKKMVGFTF